MTRTNIIALLSAVILLIVVIELVRRRRLREEYSWLWLIAAIAYLLVASLPAISTGVDWIIGASNIAVAFSFLGLFFVVSILIQYSIRLSTLTEQVKDLAQQIAILDTELRELARENEDNEEGTNSDFAAYHLQDQNDDDPRDDAPDERAYLTSNLEQQDV